MTSLSSQINILPGSGLEALPFGKSQQDCINLLGQADKDQILEEPILQTKHLVLHYHTLDLSLYFDLNKASILCSFECSNPSATINNTPVFTMDEKALAAFMKSCGYSLSETEQTTWGEKRLGFDEAGIDAFFEHKKLNLLQCGVL
jgi:hypothetical protein